MNYFFIALSVALIASAQVYAYSAGNSYHQQSAGSDHGAGEYHSHSHGHGHGHNHGHGHSGHDSGSSASAGASANGADNAAGFAHASPNKFGSNQNIPYQPANTRGNSISSSISYPNNKGEILIHRPAAIIVKRPPTKVVVNHPPLVVKPAPVVLHKPPAVVVRKVFVKHHPRPVKVEPVYVNVVKPPAEKYFVNEKQQQYAGAQQFSPVNINAASFGGLSRGPSSSGASASSGSDADFGASAISNAGESAANAGYQLLQNNQGLAALANLSGSGHGHSHGHGHGHYSHHGQSY